MTHSLYIEDPDGNEIELYIDVPGVDWSQDPTLWSTPTHEAAHALASRLGSDAGNGSGPSGATRYPEPSRAPDHFAAFRIQDNAPELATDGPERHPAVWESVRG